MWIYEQANRSLKRERNTTLFYLIACIVTSLIMFTAVNICNNEVLINSNEVTLKPSFYLAEGTPISLVKQQNLLILLIMAAGFTVVCSFNYLRKKSEEIAYLTLNGATMPDVIRYLIYQNGVLLAIGSLIGIILGIILMPLFNIIVYTMSGQWGPLITFNLNSLWFTLGFLAVNFAAVVMLNFGHLIRKEIKDLIDDNTLIRKQDRRSVKVSKYFFLILYLIPIICTVIAFNVEGADAIISTVTFIAIPGTYGMIQHFIPKTIEKLKRKKYMYDFKKLVYLSNAVDTIRKSLLFIVGLQMISTFFLVCFFDYREFTGMKENLAFCLVGVSILISMTLIYTIFIEVINNKGFYKQMKAFGYTDIELLDLVKKEIRAFFLLGVMVGVVQLICVVAVYMITGLLSITMGLGILGCILVPLIAVNIGCEVMCVKIVKENLKGGF
ncbi:MAG: FtsX-like permease family protein [Clostridium sp.]